jgi:4-amino-4-deoxy-L-arabinose transferase-like glycosyltransferase
LLPLILSFAYLFSHSLIAAHLIVALLASLGIVAIFLLTKELFDEKTAILSSIIFAILPLNVALAHDILVDSILPTFLIFTLFFAIKAFKTEKLGYYAAMAVFFALSILLKFTALSFVLILFFTFLIIKKEKKRLNLNFKNIIASIIIFFIVMLPYLIYAQITYGNFLHTFIQARTVIGWSPYTPLSEVIPEFLTLFPVSLLFFSILGMVTSITKKIKKENLILFLAILIPFILTISFAHKEIRYFMPITPFLAIFAGKGILDIFKIKKQSIKYGLIVMMIVLILFQIHAFSLLASTTNIQIGKLVIDDYEPPIMELSLWLKDNTPADTIVYTNVEWPVVAYYSEREIRLLPLFQSFTTTYQNYLTKSGYIIEDTKEEMEFMLENDKFSLIESWNEQLYLFNYTS